MRRRVGQAAVDDDFLWESGSSRVRSLRTQQRAESQCQVLPRALRDLLGCVVWGFLWLIDSASVSSRFSAVIKSSTESLILAQDERWRRA